MSYKRRWLITGGAGASLLSVGICGAIESAFLKHSGIPWYLWVLAGTVSLVLIVIGVMLLIKAGFIEKDNK